MAVWSPTEFRHQDHYKYIQSALNHGLNVFSCQDVCDQNPNVRLLKPKVRYKLGEFFITTLPVPHGVECYSYIIEHDEFGKLLFCTDLSDFPYRVNNCTHLMLEANYDEEIVLNNAVEDRFNSSASQTHLEISQTIDICKRHYSPALQSIILLHLSNGNSNAAEFKRRVQEEVGIENVYVADKGLEVELIKEEF